MCWLSVQHTHGPRLRVPTEVTLGPRPSPPQIGPYGAGVLGARENGTDRDGQEAAERFHVEQLQTPGPVIPCVGRDVAPDRLPDEDERQQTEHDQGRGEQQPAPADPALDLEARISPFWTCVCHACPHPPVEGRPTHQQSQPPCPATTLSVTLAQRHPSARECLLGPGGHQHPSEAPLPYTEARPTLMAPAGLRTPFRAPGHTHGPTAEGHVRIQDR